MFWGRLLCLGISADVFIPGDKRVKQSKRIFPETRTKRSMGCHSLPTVVRQRTVAVCFGSATACGILITRLRLV